MTSNQQCCAECQRWGAFGEPSSFCINLSCACHTPQGEAIRANLKSVNNQPIFQTTPCCDSCRKMMQDFAGFTKLGGVYATCSNRSCPCHQTTPSWEKEFHDNYGFWTHHIQRGAIDFIHRVESRAREEEAKLCEGCKIQAQEFREAREEEVREEERQGVVDELETAWGIIANAGGGNWDKETEMWRDAAAKWGDRNGFRGGSQGT